MIWKGYAVELGGLRTLESRSLMKALAACPSASGPVHASTQMGLQHRWWSILGIAMQRVVLVQAATRDTDDDLTSELLEPVPVPDLPVLAF